MIVHADHMILAKNPNKLFNFVFCRTYKNVHFGFDFKVLH